MTKRIDRRHITHCWECGKNSFDTRGDADRWLKRHVGHPTIDAEWMFPYRCPGGKGWHVGHDTRKERRREQAILKHGDLFSGIRPRVSVASDACMPVPA
jgi:hypothetical protein